MRSAVAALLAIELVSPASAQTTPSPIRTLSPLKTQPEASLAPLRLDAVDLDRIEQRARRRRGIGIGLAIPGVVFTVLGCVLIGAGANNSRLAAGAAEIAAGSVSAGFGVLLVGPGAYLWVTGQDALDAAAWRRGRMSATP